MSACHPSKSYSAILGYHCVMESATFSSEFLPERRICKGTCPSKSKVKLDEDLGKITCGKVTSNTVKIYAQSQENSPADIRFEDL